MVAVFAQALGAVLLLAAVAIWSWPVALGLAGVFLMAAGTLAEGSSSKPPALSVVGEHRRAS